MKGASESPPATTYPCLVGRRLVISLSALLLVWLPLDLLRLIDGLLLFMRWAEVADSVALYILLLTLTSLGLAGACAGMWFVSPRNRWALANAAAWFLLVVPAGTMVGFQVGASTHSWIAAIAGEHLPGGFFAKAGLSAALFMLLVFRFFQSDANRISALFAATSDVLMSASPLALTVIIAATGWLITRPPEHPYAGKPPVVIAQPTKQTTEASKPDIFLISIDSLSAIDANLCKAGDTTMPNLRRLALRGTCFSRFYASSNFTLPTTATIATGQLPWSHWAVNFDSKLPDTQRKNSLAESLRQAGYETHSINANLWASPRHQGTWRSYTTSNAVRSDSLESTFNTALTQFPDSSLPRLANAHVLLSKLDTFVNASRNPDDPARVYNAALALLATRAPDVGSSFFWLHTQPPHAPYLPAPSTRYQLLPAGKLDRWRDFMPDGSEYLPQQQHLVDEHRLRYRECIMGADAALGRFLDELERLEKLDAALIIVTADHGESFEKGYLGHSGRWLHESVIQVPLLVKLPGQRISRKVDIPTSQADIAPTLIELTGSKPLASMDGRSLVPALRGEPVPPMPVLAMNLERASRFNPIRRGNLVLIEGSLKLVIDIANGATVLHDLTTDPNESRDVAALYPADTARMREELLRRLAHAEKARSQAFDK